MAEHTNFPPHCNCADWSPNLQKINAPFALLTARNPDTYHGYNGKQFAFCPWCGSKLIEIEIVGFANDAAVTP